MSQKPSQFIKTAGLISYGGSLRSASWRTKQSCFIKYLNFDCPRRGQSLVELLIATSVIILLIGGAVTAVSVALRSSRENKLFQTANFLAQEMTDNLQTLSESDWHKVDGYGTDALIPGTAYRVTIPAPFGIASGAESIVNNGTTYSRYFNIEFVSRDGSGVIEPVYVAGNNDPSTIKIIGRVEWGNSSRVEVMRYLTRSRGRATLQTDWSGGAGQSGLFSDPGKYDSASAGIDVTSNSGSIRLSGIPYP